MVIVEMTLEGKMKQQKKEKTQKKIAKSPILFVSQSMSHQSRININARIMFSTALIEGYRCLNFCPIDCMNDRSN